MVDYVFYKDVFKGTLIPLEPFSRFGDKSLLVIKKYAPHYKDSVEVKKCICEVAEELYKQDKLDRNISSENNDGFSVTFKSDAELEKHLYDIVFLYLSRTGYMYRGKYDN